MKVRGEETEFYWAVAEGLNGLNPTCMLNCNSPQEAVESYVSYFVEEMQGDWTEGSIKVWRATNDGPAEITLFDVKATITPVLGDEADEGEVDCEIEIERRD